MSYRPATIGLLLLLTLSLLASCASVNAQKECDDWCHQNVKATEPQSRPDAYLASLNVKYDINWKCRNDWMPTSPEQRSIDACSPPRVQGDPNFIGLALSGGGSRAAVFSAAVMFELQKKGILEQVDVISSASGGSVTAALYATSYDPEHACPETPSGNNKKRCLWKEEKTLELLRTDIHSAYRTDWWFVDRNYKRFTTSYDRTDILAQTMTQILFSSGRDPKDGLLFMDLNPQRPYLIINATNNTDIINSENNFSDDPRNKRWFSFTQEHFAKIGSRLDNYPISYAVVASAAVPGLFHQATLRNFKKDWSKDKNQPDYLHIHLLDAGVTDNLAMGPLRYLCNKEPASGAANKLIILVDAHTPANTTAESDHDPRTGIIDYVLDTKALSSPDVMMDVIRGLKVEEFQNFLEKRQGKLIHIRFEDLGTDKDLYKLVSKIKTDWRLTFSDDVKEGAAYTHYAEEINTAPCFTDSKEEACVAFVALVEAAKILVGRAVQELRRDAYWKEQFHLQ